MKKKKKRMRPKNGIARVLRSPDSPFKKRVVKDKRKKQPKYYEWEFEIEL